MTKKIDEIDVAEVLKKAEKNREWIKKHYDELQANYEGKVFAVKDEKVICAHADIENVLKDVREKGEDPLFLIVESIPPRNASFIL